MKGKLYSISLLLLSTFCVCDCKSLQFEQDSKGNSLNDPLDQGDYGFESKTVVVKSVMAVPYHNHNRTVTNVSSSRCPPGERSLRPEGPCSKVFNGPAVVDDKLMVQLVKNYYSNRTTSTTSTPTRPMIPAQEGADAMTTEATQVVSHPAPEVFQQRPPSARHEKEEISPYSEDEYDYGEDPQEEDIEEEEEDFRDLAEETPTSTTSPSSTTIFSKDSQAYYEYFASWFQTERVHNGE